MSTTPGPDATTDLDGCRLTVTEAAYWRDWMPIVGAPGPDGGSPLRVKLLVAIENPTSRRRRLSATAVVRDEQGVEHPLDVELARLDGVAWDGALGPGEARTIEISAVGGPYLPAGSTVQVAMAWSDLERGGVATLVAAAGAIARTF